MCQQDAGLGLAVRGVRHRKVACSAIHLVAAIASSTAAGNFVLGREPIID
jgi:hypothetical protein